MNQQQYQVEEQLAAPTSPSPPPNVGSKMSNACKFCKKTAKKYAPKKMVRRQHALKNNPWKKHVMMDHWAPITLHKLPTTNIVVLADLDKKQATKPAVETCTRPRSNSDAEQSTLVIVKSENGERVVVQASARPISNERERVLGYGEAESLAQRGFMIIRDVPAIRELAREIAANPKCEKLDPQLKSTKFFTDENETADLLETMSHVLGDVLGANDVALAEETTARIRVGPSAAFPRVHKDLQSSWKPKGCATPGSAHGASANVFNAWFPLAEVTEKDCPLGLVPTSNTLVQISSPRSARKLFQYREDLQVFDAETFTLGKHCPQKLERMEYFPVMKPGDVLLFKSDAVFHAALTHMGCQSVKGGAKTCNCIDRCTRKSMDVRLFIS